MQPKELGLKAKEIIGYHYNPKKKVFLLSINMKNDPKALASITSILSGVGITVLSGFTSMNVETEQNRGLHLTYMSARLIG